MGQNSQHGAIYLTQVQHVRVTPIKNIFNQKSYNWLVDLDALPILPWILQPLAQFRSRDHIGDPGRTIRQNIDTLLNQHGIDLAGGRVQLLCNARNLGYVFNPLSVYWCYASDNTLAAVIAEVHNTYGDRHAYVVRTDARGRAEVDKKLYVSPFNQVDGYYELSLPEPTETLSLTVTLHRPQSRPFVASVRGTRRPATVSALLRTSLAHPWVTATVSASIRWHGIRLYLRGLRVQQRPVHQSEVTATPKTLHTKNLVPTDHELLGAS
jgi:DUF1365 family protein